MPFFTIKDIRKKAKRDKYGHHLEVDRLLLQKVPYLTQVCREILHYLGYIHPLSPTSKSITAIKDTYRKQFLHHCHQNIHLLRLHLDIKQSYIATHDLLYALNVIFEIALRDCQPDYDPDLSVQAAAGAMEWALDEVGEGPARVIRLVGSTMIGVPALIVPFEGRVKEGTFAEVVKAKVEEATAEGGKKRAWMRVVGGFWVVLESNEKIAAEEASKKKKKDEDEAQNDKKEEEPEEEEDDDVDEDSDSPPESPGERKYSKFSQRKFTNSMTCPIIYDQDIDNTDDDVRHIAAIEAGVATEAWDDRFANLAEQLRAHSAAAAAKQANKDATAEAPNKQSCSISGPSEESEHARSTKEDDEDSHSSRSS